MRELNADVTTRLTLARARTLGIPTARVPPMPWVEGRWIKPDGDVVEATATQGGAIEDGGHVLRVGDEAWQRDPATVLCFVHPEHMHGMLPAALQELGNQRNICKGLMKKWEAAGAAATDEGAKREAAAKVVYYDLQQSAIKVLMNSAYGGLGAAQGGVFSGAKDTPAIAAATTARGRELVTMVARTCEDVVWLHPPTDTAGIDGVGDPPPEGFTRPTTVYGEYPSIIYGHCLSHSFCLLNSVMLSNMPLTFSSTAYTCSAYRWLCTAATANSRRNTSLAESAAIETFSIVSHRCVSQLTAASIDSMIMIFF